MRTAEEVLALYHGRKDKLAPTHAIFRGIRAAVLGDTNVPLPELDKNEQATVANLILTGITQTGNRIASTMPLPLFPPLRPGIVLSEDRARIRRFRTADWYDKCNLKAVMRKRALHYLTYAASTVVIKPNPRYTESRSADESTVLWEVRDPLQTYAADLPTGQVVPDDCIFTMQRSYAWIEARYGEGCLAGLALAERNPDQQVTLLEYVDDNMLCMYAIADAVDTTTPDRGPMYGIIGGTTGPKRPAGKPVVAVHTMPNRAGRPLAVVAGLISLERPQSMYEGLVGLLQMQSRMMALEYIGMMRSIWPEEWAVTRPGETANIITQADPIAGILGEISGADIKINAPQPAQFGVNLIDRIERAQRVEAGIPAEYGGESATNTRTDKRGNSILSNTIDFGILAAHQAFEVSMRAENRIAADVEKGYFPGRKTFASTTGQMSYDPADLWEPNAVHYMRYAAAGSDADGLVVAGGQRLGIGTLSKRGFMEIDPIVDDPEMETQRIRSESLEALLFQTLAALAQADPNYMTVIAELNEKLRQVSATDVLAEWLTLDKEYKQKQQAAQQAQLPPEASNPGLAQPGAISAPPESLSNLGQLVNTLHHAGRSPSPPPDRSSGQLMPSGAGP